MRARGIAWWHARSAREQRLLRLAVVAGGAVVALHLGVLVATDLAQARAHLAGRQRDLAMVRRLARELAQHRAVRVVTDERPLVTRIEGATSAVVGHERVASMIPLVGATEGVAVRVVGASLGEAVRVLYEVEHGGDRVDKVDLVKHPDDPSRFDLILEIAGAASP